MITRLFLFTLLIFSTIGLKSQENDLLIRFNLQYSEDYRLSVKSINTSLDELEAQEEGKDRIVDLFIHEFYQIYEEEYQDALKLKSLSFDLYPDAIGFNAYEMPEISARKASKQLKGHRFFEFDIMLEKGGVFNSDTGGLTVKEVGLKGDKKKFRPRVIVRFKQYDERGKKLQNVKGTATAKESIVLKQNSFLRIATVGNNSTIEDNMNVVIDTFRKAMDELVEKL